MNSNPKHNSLLPPWCYGSALRRNRTGAAQHLAPSYTAPASSWEASPSTGPAEEAWHVTRQMTVAMEASSWPWLERWGPRMGVEEELEPDLKQGASHMTAPSRGSVCGPTPLPALLLMANGSMIKPCGPVNRGGCTGERKEPETWKSSDCRKPGGCLQALPFPSCCKRALHKLQRLNAALKVSSCICSLWGVIHLSFFSFAWFVSPWSAFC